MAFTRMTEYLLLKKLITAYPEALTYSQLVRGLLETYSDLKDQREVAWWFEEMEEEEYLECRRATSEGDQAGEIESIKMTERGKLYFRKFASKMVL